MILLAIDPGTVESAFVLYDTDSEMIMDKRIIDNESLLAKIRMGTFEVAQVISIEMVQSFGMAVGKETFETVFWIGRFYQAMKKVYKTRVFRKDIKIHICGTTRAKDTNIRQALIDKFGKPGTKKQPNPHYADEFVKMNKDLWSALAVAVYTHEAIINADAPLRELMEPDLA